MKRLIFACFILLLGTTASAQLSGPSRKFTRADTLRGMLTPLRTCYDINYYHLAVRVNIDAKFISGSNLFKFTATEDFKRLQFDLFDNLKIDKIVYKGKELAYKREFNAVFVDFPATIKKGAKDEFQVFYSGNPVVAKRAPWDGGFVFASDGNGKPFVSTACQGLGASAWWPTKDHQADEVDSMMISISAPKGLMDVSNGRLRSTTDTGDGYTTYNWFVSYPINNYTVSINIADYAHFTDSFTGEKGPLTIDYYVLKENLEKAKVHFAADVKPMLTTFEHWFGPYPFYRDGYKLVDAPYLGMEHQSAVTYGNKYMKGYLGSDLSGTGYGLKWDYIIVHESGHEWFGNNVTSKDIADMWIHEGFTMYSEGLFVESQQGKEAGAKYIAGVRKGIRNRSPMIGPYNVNHEGADIYNKGANMLHTVRTIIDDDEKWRSILRGLNKDLGLKTTTAEEVINYIDAKSGKKLVPVLDQYLRYANIPLLEYKKENNTVSFRWVTDVKDFKMPVKVKFANTDTWTWITPDNNWSKALALKEGKDAVIIDTDNFYIKTSSL